MASIMDRTQFDLYRYSILSKATGRNVHLVHNLLGVISNCIGSLHDPEFTVCEKLELLRIYENAIDKMSTVI